MRIFCSSLYHRILRMLLHVSCLHTENPASASGIRAIPKAKAGCLLRFDMVGITKQQMGLVEILTLCDSRPPSKNRKQGIPCVDARAAFSNKILARFSKASTKTRCGPKVLHSPAALSGPSRCSRHFHPSPPKQHLSYK